MVKEKNCLVFVGLSVQTRWNAFRVGLSSYDHLTEVCNFSSIGVYRLPRYFNRLTLSEPVDSMKGVKSKAEPKTEDARLSVKRKASARAVLFSAHEFT